MTRIAVLQMTSGIDPAVNKASLVAAIEAAAAGGAAMLFTPEMSGLLDADRARAAAHIVSPEDNETLRAARTASAKTRIWVHLGSLAVRRPDGRWANRGFVLAPDGSVAAQYDKIHMFDVDIAPGEHSGGERWRESAAYAAGDRVVTCATPVGRLGLTICYDLRFPRLYAALALARCDCLAVPAAFTRPTGAAHWHVLLRARAIEASAYVIAAAQVGCHQDSRKTFGHSLVVDPWGEVLLDMGGQAPGLGFADLDPARLAAVRAQIPSLANAREIPI